MIITLVRKTFRDHWRSLLGWAGVIVFMSCVQLYVYPTIVETGEGMNQFLDAFPDTLKEIFRMQDYTSGPGFLSTELFSMLVPLVMIAVGSTWGSSATAEEEERGTADLLFTLPVTRTKITGGKILATITACLLLAVVTFINIFVGSPLVDLEVSTKNLIAICFSGFLLGVFFSSVGLIFGVITGKKSVGLGVTTAIAILAFLFYSLAPLVDTFDYLTPINPIEWCLGGNQLFDGPDYFGYFKLSFSSTILFTVATFLFNRKDIRS